MPDEIPIRRQRHPTLKVDADVCRVCHHCGGVRPLTGFWDCQLHGVLNGVIMTEGSPMPVGCDHQLEHTVSMPKE